jgi:Tfp pilus assembly protein PilW
MNISIRAALAVLAAWTLHAAPGAAQDARPPLARAPTEIEAPLKVGEYVRGERHDYKDLTNGVSFPYAPTQKSDSSWATVYIYQPVPPDSAWDAARVIADEAEGFRQTLEYQRARGVYEAYEIAHEEADSVRAGPHVLPGFRITYAYRTRGQIAVSFYSVYAAGRTLIKVRGTVPESQVRKTTLPGFAREVTAAIVQANSSAPP